MRTLLVGFLVMLPALSGAQTLTLAYPQSGQAELDVSPDDCGDEVTLTWAVTAGTQTCGDLQFWVTNGTTCSDDPGSADYLIDTIPQASWGATANSGTIQMEVSSLPGYAAAGATCGAAGIDFKNRICGRGEIISALGACNASTNDRRFVRVSPSLEINYDALPPAAPTITNVTALDGALRVSFSGDDDTESVRVEYRVKGESDWAATSETGIDIGSITISDLENGTEYELQAYALDGAGNVSTAASPIVTGTPVETSGFADAYGNAGGKEKGGCSTTLGPSAFVSVVLLIGLLRGEKRPQ